MGRRVLVDPGTSSYEDGPVREAERSTRAHDTVEVNGEDSSEMWSVFRVGHRPHTPLNGARSTPRANRSDAWHDENLRSAGVRHRRTWLLDDGLLTVRDHLDGRGQVGVALGFLLHPTVRSRRADPSSSSGSGTWGTCARCYPRRDWNGVSSPHDMHRGSESELRQRGLRVGVRLCCPSRRSRASYSGSRSLGYAASRGRTSAARIPRANAAPDATAVNSAVRTSRSRGGRRVLRRAAARRS